MPESHTPRIPRTSFLACVTGALICAGPSPLNAQTWETVDDIFPRANAKAITADSAGNVFVAGVVKDESSPYYHAVVMKSSDSGVTWETSASKSSTGAYVSFSAMGCGRLASGENHVVATGLTDRVSNSAGMASGKWLVIRSRDAGASWQTVDEYTHPSYSQQSAALSPRGAAVDASGTIYIAGTAEENIVSVKGKTTTTKSVNHWLIRKGVPATDGTVQWSTTDFAFPTSKEHQRANVSAASIACVGNDVYVTGGGGTDGNYWRVMKSSNGGATWTVSDNFALSTRDAPSHAHSIAADSAGNLYVAGAAMSVVSGESKMNWIVRKGMPGGTNWTTVDYFSFPGGFTGGHAWARGVTVAPNGDVHVTGNTRLTTDRWHTRQLSAATGLWSPADDFAHAINPNTVGRVIAADPYGNVFAAGYAADSSGVYQDWLVRRKLAP